MLLAIDPGADTGWALFCGPTLVMCGLGSPPEDLGGPLEKVLIETPKARPGDPNPQSLIVLARNAGEWAGVYRNARPEYLTPNDWKGSTPKTISHARIWAKLSPSEQVLADGVLKRMRASARHNVLDAIGIGLHGVGRNANGR